MKQRKQLRKNLKGVVLHVRVIDELAMRLEEEAEGEGFSRSDLLRRILLERYRLPKTLQHT